MTRFLRRPLSKASMMVVTMMVGLTGCRWHFPHSLTLESGPIERRHAKPMEGGYYTNFDPFAASIELSPAKDLNPVQTQHVLVATVRDKDGKPLANRRVEWIIAEGSVGDIVEVDESGWRASRGHKVTNHYAVTHTNNFEHVLTRGTDDPSDDIHLQPGDTWCVITSPIEGTTHIVAYAPGIYDWDKHKVFAEKLWQDVDWVWPADATNPTGTTHDFTTTVMKYSDGSPLSDYIVNYSVVSGPPARINGSGTTASLRTDGQGQATINLSQVQPERGVNEIAIEIIRPADTQCCKPAQVIATGTVTKTWIPPEIAITKDAPAQACIGETFDYSINVSNPSSIDAQNVTVRDMIPSGLRYVSSSPAAQASGNSLTWSLGVVEGGGSRALNVTVEAADRGSYDNCAEVSADQGLADRDCAQTMVGAAALALDKSCPSTVSSCDDIPIELVVRNTGDCPARNVVVTDQLPGGWTSVDGYNELRFDAGTLQPGEAKRADFTVKSSQTGSFTNTARATSDGGYSAEASCQTTVSKPELRLTKTGPSLRYVGRSVRFELTVENVGNADARDTAIIDTLPSGCSVSNISDGGQQSGGQVTWNVGTLGAGQSRTVSLELMPNQRGVFRNAAVARAFCAEAAAEASTEVKGIPAILLEVIDLEDPVEVGTNTTYEIVVTNQGSAEATNIIITCKLPNELQYVAAESVAAVDVTGQNITFAPIPTLAPKGRVVYRVTAQGVGTGDVRFTVVLQSDQIDSPVQETESTHVYSD